jgi:hypothetical protein
VSVHKTEVQRPQPCAQALPTSSFSVHAALDLSKIQAIRLIHALAESKMPIHVPLTDEFRFPLLRKVFGFSSSPLPPLTIAGVGFVHAEPRTYVGSMSRPLIYPHSLADWCRQAWPRERDVWASFCGLITPERSAVLASWVGSRSGQWPLDLAETRVGENFSGHAIHLAPGIFHLSPSTRGRRFPVKAWDAHYYAGLLRSKFVLCPNGEYAWSYRFFESTLCGAIPVVEEDCAVYRGFRYFRLSDGHFDWDPADALHNYDLCRERILVPAEELRGELQELASQARSAPCGIPTRLECA